MSRKNSVAADFSRRSNGESPRPARQHRVSVTLPFSINAESDDDNDERRTSVSSMIDRNSIQLELKDDSVLAKREASVRKTQVQNRVNSTARKQLAAILLQQNAKFTSQDELIRAAQKKDQTMNNDKPRISKNRSLKKGIEDISTMIPDRPPRSSVGSRGAEYDGCVDIFVTEEEEQETEVASGDESDFAQGNKQPQTRMTSFMQGVSRLLTAYQRKATKEKDTKTLRLQKQRQARQSLRSGDLIHHLPRGGVYVMTSVGPVQFGIPPETVKDSMELGLRVPSIYVVPNERFNLSAGVNVCEIEFPAFFNFFVLSKMTTLITHRDCYEDLLTIMSEALNGPSPDLLFAEKEYSDFCPQSVRDACPDHEAEIFHFRAPNRVPGQTPQLLDVDMLLQFKFFDENGVCDLGEGVLVYDDGENARFELQDDKMQQQNAGKVSEDTIGEYQNESIMIAYRQAESCTVPASAGLVPKLDITSPESAAEAVKLASPHSSGKDVRVSSLESTSTLVGGDRDRLSSGEMSVKSNKASARKSLIKFSSRSSKRQSSEERHAPNSDGSGDTSFTIPKFGLTVLGNSHGFDPRGSTSGFVLWVNGQGVMVDPPPHSTSVLLEAGIPPNSITAIILTHCHADHDAGTFQKMITEHKVTLMTTTTVFESFKRKYAAVSGLRPEFIQKLVNFRPMFLEEPNYWNGASFRFFYSLHSIPCVGFRVNLESKSIIYSGDTFYDPPSLMKMYQDGILSHARLEALMNFEWNCDIVLHEAGVPPIHTPIEALADVPEARNKNIYLIHIDRRAADRAETFGFRIAKAGVENTMVLIPRGEEYKMLKFLQLVSSMEIFGHFDVSQALDLTLMTREVLYPKGSLIIKKGMVYEKFMIILQGRAAVDLEGVKKFFRAGDYLGELAVWNQTNIKNGQKKGKKDKLTDEDYTIVKETVQAETDVKVMELDKYALNYLLMKDEILRERLESMIHTRVDGSWEAISSNSKLRLLSSMQKTQLQALLSQQQLVRGDVVWKAGETVSVAVLISRGSLIFEEIHGSLEDYDFEAEGDDGEDMKNLSRASDSEFGERHAPLSTGFLIFDYYGVHGGRPLTTTLVCQSEEATIFLLKSEAMLKFLDKNPRILLALLKSSILV